MKLSEIQKAVFISIANVQDVYPEAVEQSSSDGIAMEGALDSLDKVELIMFLETDLGIDLESSEVNLKLTAHQLAVKLNEKINGEK